MFLCWVWAPRVGSPHNFLFTVNIYTDKVDSVYNHVFYLSSTKRDVLICLR